MTSSPARHRYLQHLRHARACGNIEAAEIARWCLWASKRGRFRYS